MGGLGGLGKKRGGGREGKGRLTAVVFGVAQEPAAAGVEGFALVRVLPRGFVRVRDAAQRAVFAAVMHRRQFRSHLAAGYERGVVDAQGLEDVLLEVGAERLAGYSLDEHAYPVDVQAVGPVGAGFEFEGLLEAGERALEFVELRVLVDAGPEVFAEECVAEAGWEGGLERRGGEGEWRRAGVGLEHSECDSVLLLPQNLLSVRVYALEDLDLCHLWYDLLQLVSAVEVRFALLD